MAERRPGTFATLHGWSRSRTRPRPLSFDVSTGCSELESYLETMDGKPVSYLNDCALGALCGGGSDHWALWAQLVATD